MTPAPLGLMERALPALPHLAEGDERILQLLAVEPPSHHRNCFRCAIQHLHLSYALHTVDPAMAMFRAITAEEEAASGLLRCLISRGYPLSEHLRPREHVQKHAVTPFLQSIVQHLSNLRFDALHSVRLAVKEVEGAQRLVVAMNIGESEQELWATPTPPLNMSFREGPDMTAPTFHLDFKRLIEPKGYKNIRSFLDSEVNLRNRILYAAPDGIPFVEGLKVEFMVDRQHRVLSMIKALLLISPYAEHQPFVVEALRAFLILVGKLNAEPSSNEA